MKTCDSRALSVVPGSAVWTPDALDEVAKFAARLKEKCDEISVRCLLDNVTSYTVKMAVRELCAEGFDVMPNTEASNGSARKL